MVENTIDINQMKANFMAEIMAQFLQTMHDNNSRYRTKMRLLCSDLLYQCMKLRI